MGKAYLIKRLSMYYPLERFHAYFTFPILTLKVLFSNSPLDTLFLLYGLLVIIFILFQGQHYWKLKLKRLTGKEFNQQKNLQLFLKARTINAYLIALMPVVFVFQLYLSGWKIIEENKMMWALLANGFGILEHINYYYRQLSIDNRADVKYLIQNKKLKIASLAKDLRDKEI